MKRAKLFNWLLVIGTLASLLVGGGTQATLVSAAEPPEFEYGHLETDDAPSIAPVKEPFTVPAGYIAAIWWKIKGLGSYVGLWLPPGDYTYQAAGRVRFWDVVKLCPSQLAELKLQWEAVVQFEAGEEAPDYVWTDLSIVGADAAESGPIIDWGSLEEEYVPQPDGYYTIPAGQLAAVWFKPKVDGKALADYSRDGGCFGAWLEEGTYEISAPEGAMRVWDISDLTAAQVVELKAWWEIEVQEDADFCTYEWREVIDP